MVLYLGRRYEAFDFIVGGPDIRRLSQGLTMLMHDTQWVGIHGEGRRKRPAFVVPKEVTFREDTVVHFLDECLRPYANDSMGSIDPDQINLSAPLSDEGCTVYFVDFPELILGIRNKLHDLRDNQKMPPTLINPVYERLTELCRYLVIQKLYTEEELNHLIALKGGWHHMEEGEEWVQQFATDLEARATLNALQQENFPPPRLEENRLIADNQSYRAILRADTSGYTPRERTQGGRILP